MKLSLKRRALKLGQNKLKSVKVGSLKFRSLRLKPLKVRNLTVKPAVTLAVVLLFITIFASAALVSSTPVVSKKVSSKGHISVANVGVANIGVYSDGACTQVLTSIEWGSVSPGASATRAFYIKNEGNTQVTVYLSTTNWTPVSADGPLKLTWDKEGATLDINSILMATMTLSVSPSVNGITDFGVDPAITAVG